MGSRKGWREGKKTRLWTDGQHKKEQRRAKRRVNQQEKEAAIRAEYGPLGKPAPVTTRKIDQ